MAGELGLNEHHTATVINYLRFDRFKRDQRLKVVDGAFEELKDSRLSTDETFTADEVISMLDGLCAVVKGDMESELINTAHTNVLLLHQMFEQAETWRLKLNADVSQLENKELIDKVALMEEKHFSSSASVSKTSLAEKKRLQPLNEEGGTALLHMEIERMKEENERLRARIQTAESKATEALTEKSQLKSQLDDTRQSLEKAKISEKQTADQLAHLETKSSSTSNQLPSKGVDSQVVKALEDQLTQTKHELLAAKAEVETTKEELDKKVSETSQFSNMKKMLSKKNDQLKELRTRLKKYEPNAVD